MSDGVVKAPERIETARLVFRRPMSGDAKNMFSRYASDPEVTRYVSWTRHASLEDTNTFLELCDSEWAVWPAGPYLVESRERRVLVGSTGLAYDTAERASTGFVFAKDAWGNGYATEALKAMVELAVKLKVIRLQAFCHVRHKASSRVLEKCEFTREGTLQRYARFPNLGSKGELADVFCYARILA